MDMQDQTLIIDLVRNRLATGTYAKITIVSNSMAPILQRGDSVKIKSVPIAELRPGDIVVVETDDGLLTHRYHSIRSRQLLLCGDFSKSYDPLYSCDQLIGVVITKQDLRTSRSFSFTSFRGRLLNRILLRLSKLRQQYYLISTPERNLDFILDVLFYGVVRTILFFLRV